MPPVLSFSMGTLGFLLPFRESLFSFFCCVFKACYGPYTRCFRAGNEMNANANASSREGIYHAYQHLRLQSLLLGGGIEADIVITIAHDSSSNSNCAFGELGARPGPLLYSASPFAATKGYHWTRDAQSSIAHDLRRNFILLLYSVLFCNLAASRTSGPVYTFSFHLHSFSTRSRPSARADRTHPQTRFLAVGAEESMHLTPPHLSSPSTQISTTSRPRSRAPS